MTPRLRYSEYKQNSPVQRDPSYYWRKVDIAPTDQDARGHSPITIWSFSPESKNGGKTYRWSSSNMSNSIHSGQATPTDSLVNNFPLCRIHD